MLSSALEQGGWFNWETIDSFHDTINNGISVESVSEIFFEFSLFLDFGRDVLFLFLIFELVELDGAEVELVEIVDMREIFLEPLHELAGKVGLVELIFLPDGVNRLGPVVSELFLKWGQPESFKTYLMSLPSYLTS